MNRRENTHLGNLNPSASSETSIERSVRLQSCEAVSRETVERLECPAQHNSATLKSNRANGIVRTDAVGQIEPGIAQTVCIELRDAPMRDVIERAEITTNHRAEH